MKFFILMLILILFINVKKSIQKFLFNEVYRIKSLENNLYFSLMNNMIVLSNKQINFKFITAKKIYYCIKINRKNEILGINEKNEIILYKMYGNTQDLKMLWNILEINKNEYLIQNLFNKKFIEVNNDNLQFSDIKKVFKKKNAFNFLKLFEENNIFNKKNIKLIQNEKIDIVIKYIDLNDISLNRTGIKQIYKDQNCEELKYSIRGILEYIPWVRKIFILMPNENISFFKSHDEINEKIIYIKDKDILGFDSANSPAFSFNLFKMEKFGISKNIIYMDDDYFIGKPLKKIDFFYYDEKSKKILPYLITSKFSEMNKTDVLERYHKLFLNKDLIHPHSGDGFWLQHLCTKKFFIDHYNFSLIDTEFTHNAIPENIDDLKEVFEAAKSYEYIKETLFSIERHILTLSHQIFYILYQLNIKRKKVHSINWKYIQLEKVNKAKLNAPLFVINTGGNHKPLSRQYKIMKKIINKRFPFKNKYEIITNIKKDNFKIKRKILIIKIFQIVFTIKIIKNKW